MLSPEQITEIAAKLLELYQRIESDLLLSVASRFSALEGAPISGMAAWQVEKLNQLGVLRAENVKLIAKYSGVAEKEIAKALIEAGYKAVEYDEAVYARAFDKGLLQTAASPLKASPSVQQILDAAITNARQVFNLVNTVAIASASDAFLEIVNQAYLETSLGVRSYTDAIRTAVRNLADKGITGVKYVDKLGRTINYQIDTAVRRAILTSSTQTAGKIQLQRARDWGCNLVEVTSHIGARPSHAEWQGKIYSVDGSTAEYPNLAAVTGYGTADGLKGINCRHDMYPFFEGLSEQTYKPYDMDENERAYREAQEQRALERDIRQQKRRILAAEEIGDEQTLMTARVKLKEKEAKLKAFLEESGRTKRSDRQQVYGFGRSQASSASWAGRKAGV